MRTQNNPNVDSRVFTRTAMNVRKINVSPRPYRGGIRL